MIDARSRISLATCLILPAVMLLAPAEAAGQTDSSDVGLDQLRLFRIQAVFYEVRSKTLRQIAELDEADLDNLKGVKVIARPQIHVLDGCYAEFSSVGEIPVASSVITEQVAIGTTEFREFGLTFQVEPRAVAADRMVCDVEAQLSELVGFTPGENRQPIIARKAVATTLRLTDGEAKTLRLPGSAAIRGKTAEANGEIQPRKGRQTEVVLRITAHMAPEETPVAKAKPPVRVWR